jgi:hypothetical protein
VDECNRDTVAVMRGPVMLVAVEQLRHPSRAWAKYTETRWNSTAARHPAA